MIDEGLPPFIPAVPLIVEPVLSILLINSWLEFTDTNSASSLFALNLSGPTCIRVWKIVVTLCTVGWIMEGASNCFEIKVRTDLARVKNMRITRFRQVKILSKRSVRIKLHSYIFRLLRGGLYPLCSVIKRVCSRSLFRTSSSDTDFILTFSLGSFVPTLRRFCRLRSTIW